MLKLEGNKNNVQDDNLFIANVYLFIILQAILDTCCDKPGILVAWGDELSVNNEGDFVLTDPECIVSLILSSPNPWSAHTLLLFLKSLLCLLRDDHPHREFNAAQLNRANALDSILYFCKVCIKHCYILILFYCNYYFI